MSDPKPTGICPPIVGVVPSVGQADNNTTLSLTLNLGDGDTGGNAHASFKVTDLPQPVAATAAAPSQVPAEHPPTSVVPSATMAISFKAGDKKVLLPVRIHNILGKHVQLIVSASTSTPPPVSGVYVVKP